MKCKYVRLTLEEYLEGELAPSDIELGESLAPSTIKNLKKHLEECAECRKELELLLRDRKLLGDALHLHRLPRDFTDKVMSTLSGQRSDTEVPTLQHPNTPVLRLWAWLSAAAALLLAVTLTFILVSMKHSGTETLRELSVATAPSSEGLRLKVESARGTLAPLETTLASEKEAETAGRRFVAEDSLPSAEEPEKLSERAKANGYSAFKGVEAKEQAKAENEVGEQLAIAHSRGRAAEGNVIEPGTAKEPLAGKQGERQEGQIRAGATYEYKKNLQRGVPKGRFQERRESVGKSNGTRALPASASTEAKGFATVDIIAGSLAYKTETDLPVRVRTQTGRAARDSWRWGLVGESLPKSTTIKTGPNSLASFTLADGSQLKLNGGTQISFVLPAQLGDAAAAEEQSAQPNKLSRYPAIPLSRGVNAIKLDRGDVWLHVAKPTLGEEAAKKIDGKLQIPNSDLTNPTLQDERLPYTIITDKAEVRITGTTLAVSASPRETATTVTEGKVVVSRKGKELALEAGQRGIVSDTVTAKASIKDATKDLAWATALKGVAHSSHPVSPARQIRLASIGRIDAKDPNTGETSPISIRQLYVDVAIQDQIAKTTIEEVFANAADRQLEGTFYFPLPPGASISRLAMYVGDKLMEGEIVERKRAREVYEDIVRKMEDPALLEWESGNIFKCRVFPIPARGGKRIILSYTQVLRYDYGRVQYVYPMVEGMSGVNAVAELRGQKPSLSEKLGLSDELRLLGEFRLNVAIQSAPEIKAIRSPSHECEIAATEHSASVGFSAHNYTPDSDFILNYQIARDDNQFFARPYRKADDENGYFMLRLFPNIEVDGPGDAPKDYLFVVDTSGSISWREYKAEMKVVRTLLNEMSAADRFNVVCYDIIAARLGDGFIPCTADNKGKAADFLNSIVPSGASDIKLAFENVSALLRKRAEKKRPACVFFISDGLATVGPGGAARDSRVAADGSLKDEIKRDLAGLRPSIYPIAIGSRYDARLLGWLAKELNGVLRRFSLGEDVAERAFELAISLTRPMMRDVRIAVDDSVIFNVSPRSLANVYQGQDLIITGLYKHSGKTTITLTGTVNGEAVKRSYDMNLPEVSKENAFVPRLWARRYIGFLLNQISPSDPKKEPINKIIELSKAYSIMTPFTSFLVLESERQYEEYQIERRKKKEYWKDEKKGERRLAQEGEDAEAAPKPKSGLPPGGAASKGARALRPRTLAERRAAERAKNAVVWNKLRKNVGITFPGVETTLENVRALISPLSEVNIIIDPDAQSSQGLPIADTPFVLQTVTKDLTFEDILDLATDALSLPPKDEVWWIVKNMAVFITDKDGYKRYLKIIRPLTSRTSEDFGRLNAASQTTMPVRDFGAEDVQRNIDRLGRIEGKDHFTVLNYNGAAGPRDSIFGKDFGMSSDLAIAGSGGRREYMFRQSVQSDETRAPSLLVFDKQLGDKGLGRQIESQGEIADEREIELRGRVAGIKVRPGEMPEGQRRPERSTVPQSGGEDDEKEFDIGTIGIKDGDLLIQQTAAIHEPLSRYSFVDVQDIVDAWNESERTSKAPEASEKNQAELRTIKSLSRFDDLTDNDLRKVKRVVDDELQLREYTAGVRKTQQDANFYRRTARVLARRGDWDGTLRAFSTIVEMNPQDVSARRELAQLYQSRKLYDKAFEEFKTVLKLKPDEQQSYTDISQLARLWGKPEIVEDTVLTQAGDMIEADVKVILSWDTDETDVDLWVLDPSGEKCFYSHRHTKSGGRLFADVTTGRGPEVFIQQKAIPGDYKIVAHYYSEGGEGETRCKAIVILHAGGPNEVRKEYNLTLTKRGDQKEIAAFAFPHR